MVTAVLETRKHKMGTESHKGFAGSQLATNLKILVAKWKGLVANDKC